MSQRIPNLALTKKEIWEYVQEKYGCPVQVANFNILTVASRKLYNWPNDLVFEGKRLVYLTAMTLDDLAQTLEGNELITDDNFINGLVSLVDDKNRKIIEREPLVSFNPRLNDGKLYTLDNILPITNQCKVEFTPGTSIAANKAVVFQMGYIEEDMLMVPKRELMMLEEAANLRR